MTDSEIRDLSEGFVEQKYSCGQHYDEVDFIGFARAVIAAQLAAPASCQHRIVDARNAMVESGYLCRDCGAVFAAGDHDAQLAAPGAPERDYTRTFNAIGKAVTVRPAGMISISVKAFWEAYDAAQLAAPETKKKADFYCFPAGTYPIAKPAPGERQSVQHYFDRFGQCVHCQQWREQTIGPYCTVDRA